ATPAPEIGRIATHACAEPRMTSAGMPDSVVPGAPASRRVAEGALARATAAVGPIPTNAPAMPLLPASPARPGQTRGDPLRASSEPSGDAEPSAGTGGGSPSQRNSALGDVVQWVAASHST